MRASRKILPETFIALTQGVFSSYYNHISQFERITDKHCEMGDSLIKCAKRTTLYVLCIALRELHSYTL